MVKIPPIIGFLVLLITVQIYPLPLVLNLVYYLRLEIAIIVIPSIKTAIAGATVPPFAPARNIHIAKAIQMIPTMNLSFLIYSPYAFDCAC